MNVIPGNIIPHKRERLMSHQLQKLRRIKRRQLAPVRPPPPLEESVVGAAVLEAVEVLVDGPAGIIGVRRSGVRVGIGDPFADGEIAREGGENGKVAGGEDLRAESRGGGGGGGFERGLEKEEGVIEERESEGDSD